MPTATRTFRVFVSSTFEDFKAERDMLQRDVFPKLRKLCEEKNERASRMRWRSFQAAKRRLLGNDRGGI
jgi:hypothetical protein